MIADLKPYAEYKESSVPWFGRLPAHWNLKRLGSIFAERGESNEKRAVNDILSVLKGRGVIPYSEKGRIGNKASDDIGRYKIVRPDDLVLNCMNVIIGSLGRSSYTGCLSPVYYVLKRRDPANNPRYLEFVFRDRQFHESFVRIGNGILAHRMRIPMEKLKAELFPLPPPNEQAAIVRFLDWANGRLEQAIRAKRKVIALLNEQKQAIIDRAVTRGLDPNVKLKPSGVPWLGEIPVHWEVRKIKSLVKTIGGMTPNKGIERYWTGQTPWVSPKDMKVPEIFDSQDHISEAALVETSIEVVSEQAVLIVVRGMILARTFPTAVSRVPLTINQDMKALVPRPELSVEFFRLLLSGIQRELLSLVEIAGHGTCCLRTDSWAAFCLPIPPLSEQRSITNHLETGLAKTERATSRLEREIDLLREYRTRLVADVVTGKLDVREAASKLPDDEPMLDAADTDNTESDDDFTAEDETDA
jgi:type I restriction enzyme S subunit